ncbi:MAG: NADH-quinone oxidoreductase subunit N [Bacteroidetes bacterium]|nr:MAG: NADH-quinone oxidoreductase subunit N [Bacteroidota bacterium]
MTTLLYTTCLGLFCMLAEVLNLRKLLIPIVVLGLATIFAANLQLWNIQAPLTLGPISIDHMMRMDNFAIAFSGLAIFISLLIFILSANYYQNEQHHLSDYLSILVFVLCGALVMFSFANMAMLFLGIEILSISLYIMAGSRRFDTRSNEAGFKYFLMGSFASGILLFGIALIYGASGSFELAKIAEYAGSGSVSPMFYTGMTLMVFAMLFKVSAVPFHFWSPDVYEGSPALITTLMSTLVKVAAFAALYRLFSTCFLGSIDAVKPILIIVTAATIVVGNIIALSQQNVKRILAYSGIAHAGYMLMGIISIQTQTDSAVFFYATAYSLATIGFFSLGIMVFKSAFTENVEAFNGLGKKNPLAAACISICLLSLAGIPPFAGFLGKYYIFSETVKNGYITITLIAVINSIIAVYYYFKVIIAMYAQPANDKPLVIHPTYWLVAIVCVLLTIGIGLMPDYFMQLLK